MPRPDPPAAPTPTTGAADELERACERLGLAALLARMAAGDEAALTAFHHILADRLFSMALRVLDDHAAAADALQDCMVRVWRTAGRFDPTRGNAFTWVAMILHGLCLDQLRRRGRHATRLARWREETEEPPADARRGLEDLFFRETVGLVRGALDELSAPERECLESALFSPDSTARAAERLGVAPGTLKVRTHRAMQRLRDLLGAQLPSPR